MAGRIRKGPLPAGFAMARDTDPLPADALVRFQVISRGPNPRHNYRWVLHSDGRLFLARHSDRVESYAGPFDTPLPTEPTAALPAARVAEVEAKLRAADFLRQPPYQARPGVKDGAFYVVTARLDGTVHEVIYETYDPPLVAYLARIAERFETD